MFRSEQSEPATYKPILEPIHAVPSIVPIETSSRVAVAATECSLFGKNLTLLGDITGSESFFIDGKVEGSITLTDSRVTVGPNGFVDAGINAKEIVVMGRVRGDIVATDYVNIHAEGSVTGDVVAARVNIESGAFFKGRIDIRKSEAKQAHSVAAAMSTNDLLKQASSS
jgi:cytoskeletal protein CcmA (bactofilin family)